jgi:hypothetical protein
VRAGRPVVLVAIACAALTAGAGRPVHADPMPPEDPVKAAQSTAQWREHLAAEDRERKLLFDGDRSRMKEHRAVLKLLVGARARYDRAKTKAAVLAIQKRLPATVDDVRRRMTQIDHWGTSSNLLADYDAYLKALADSYPAARIESLAGRPAPLDALRGDLDQRTRHIKDWLAEAAAPQDDKTDR